MPKLKARQKFTISMKTHNPELHDCLKTDGLQNGGFGQVMDDPNCFMYDQK